jgi:probable rRNA maturation factor
MDNVVDVVIDDHLWNRFDLEDMASSTLEAVVTKLDLVNGPYELSILACDDGRIAILNKEFRGKYTPTNVLSWPMHDLQPAVAGGKPDALPLADFGDPFVNIGDIAISFQTCQKEAEAAGIEIKNYTSHLLIHGILHLLGYDHETDADAEMMETLEIDLLASMGIGNPYKDV